MAHGCGGSRRGDTRHDGGWLGRSAADQARETIEGLSTGNSVRCSDGEAL